MPDQPDEPLTNAELDDMQVRCAAAIRFDSGYPEHPCFLSQCQLAEHARTDLPRLIADNRKLRDNIEAIAGVLGEHPDTAIDQIIDQIASIRHEARESANVLADNHRLRAEVERLKSAHHGVTYKNTVIHGGGYGIDSSQHAVVTDCVSREQPKGTS